jgi:uncharacterized membrane protein HdeD (DUF308 family)
MFKATSTHLIAIGVLAIISGIIALAWPGITILALVILFAIYAFSDAGVQFVRTFTGGGVGPGFGHLLLGVLDVFAGLVALAWPGATALVLVLIVAFWAFFGGFAEIFAAFRSGETAGTRLLFITGGLVSVVFGIVLFSRPGLGAVTLALLFGLFALAYGVSQIAMGSHLRQAR